MEPVTLAILALGSIAVLGKGKRRSGSARVNAPKPTAGQRGVWRAQIRELADQLSWPGLADYLVVVASFESGYNPKPTNQTSDYSENRARGWFGMRPKGGLSGPLEGMDPALLEVPEIAVVSAADLIWRNGNKYRGDIPFRQVNWGDVRRSWAYPSNLDDRAMHHPRSSVTMSRLADAENKTGLYIAKRPAFPGNMQWIGIEAGLARLGVEV